MLGWRRTARSGALPIFRQGENAREEGGCRGKCFAREGRGRDGSGASEWPGLEAGRDPEIDGKERSSPMITAGRRRREDDFFPLREEEVDERRNENTDR